MPDELTVTAIEPANKGCKLVMSNGQRIWTPDAEKAKELVGKPIPGTWTRQEGDYGPRALPPQEKRSGPPAAFKNTKEGFEAEQKMWARKQEVEEERRDRRTALMQAVEWCHENDGTAETLLIADNFYGWLRETSGADHSTASGSGSPSPSGGGGTNTDPKPPISQPEETGMGKAQPSADAEGGGEEAHGLGDSSPSEALPFAIHVHEWTPAPRDGWVVCACGVAEKASKV